MRRAIPLLLALTGLGALAGCGDSASTSDETVTGTNAAAAATAAATTTAPAPTTTSNGATAAEASKDSPYVVVSSLLGKQMPKEPQCRFAKSFVPDDPAAGSYDGALSLTVRCEKTDGYRGMGQIVNRAGSKPTEITCRDTTAGQLYCIYVPTSTVGLYFTGTDRTVVRRRLEHLIEIVTPLPAGITPLSGTSSP
jgi:hypothetical protein